MQTSILLLNPAPDVISYAGLPTNERPNYSRTCGLCSVPRIFYPNTIVDPTTYKDQYVCRPCQKAPIVLRNDGSLATVKAEAVVQTKSETVKVVKTKIAGLPRIPVMFEQNIIKAGDVFSILKHEGSEATVVTAKTVSYQDKEMTFNTWGEAVLGHKAVNIYVHAVNVQGKTLNDLRAEVK
jgi:hypothetical protein